MGKSVQGRQQIMDNSPKEYSVSVMYIGMPDDPPGICMFISLFVKPAMYDPVI